MKKLQMHKVVLKKQSDLKKSVIPLASSKSESNRALIINKLAGGISNLENLSSARDTQIMKKLLHVDVESYDVHDAGTVMRFMTAYLALTAGSATITGTERMCLRPIGLLVDALNELGANIVYKNEEGYPPMLIDKIEHQKSNELTIPGNISSQYISALLMIAPCLPQGLKINMSGQIYSMPYIKMTLGLMSHFGINYEFEDQTISISSQEYKSNNYTIESDWSGASYWYAFAALAEEAEIKLLGLKQDSFQGDQAIVEIMEMLGVSSTFEADGVVLKKKESLDTIKYDFRNCPDLAQTIMTVAAAKGVRLEMSGLESLKIKETDRTAAMSTELSKIGANLEEQSNGIWVISERTINKIETPIVLNTYEDHRMAMALAPLCMLYDIEINDPSVVQKSYPEYWEHLELVGINVIPA
jgi:3-phosphoshikimate 1-carboxyvinyltransferase